MWLEEITHTEQLFGGVVKYTVRRPANTFRDRDELCMPDPRTQLAYAWEETLVPQLYYGHGIFIGVSQLIVCLGKRLFVELGDGQNHVRPVTLLYGHALYIPELVWFRYLAKDEGICVVVLTDGGLAEQRDSFHKMSLVDYARIQQGPKVRVHESVPTATACRPQLRLVKSDRGV